AKAILQGMGIQKPRVILVTSDYHAFRAAYMARSMGLKVKSKPSKTPSDALKKQRRKMEFFYFINYAMGWETGKRKRPAWYDKGVKWLQK
ncbi:MAG: YdcF family protein, partial [Clostridia bacterium]|nr:YdcF family protein [Clostridia bacterium]